MSLISRATDVLATSYSHHRKNDQPSSESVDPSMGFDGDLEASVGVEEEKVNSSSGSSSLVAGGSASAVVSPDEMYRLVFFMLEEEMAGDIPYLVSVIVEYLRRFVT